MSSARRAVIAIPHDFETEIDDKHDSAWAADPRIRGVALSTVGQPGTQTRHETRWLVPGGYIVKVTLDQGGHTFNISKEDNWPAGRFGPWDDHRRMFNLADLLKFGHVTVTHVDQGSIRRFQLLF